MRWLTWLLLVLAISIPTYGGERSYPTKGSFAFTPLPAGAVEPQGWLRDWAESARDGYTAHMNEVHLDFQHAWAADFAPSCQVGDWVAGAWHLEGGGYWFDGLVRLAYALHDEELIAMAKQRLEPVLENANADEIGYFYWLKRNNPDDLKSVQPDNGWGLWANGLFGHAMTAYYAASGDPRALQAMRYANDSRDIRCVTVLGYQFAPNATWNAIECYRMSGDPNVAEVLDRVFDQRDVDWPETWAMYRSLPPDELQRGDKIPTHFVDYNLHHYGYQLHGAVVNEILTGWAMGTLWTGRPEFLETVTAWANLLDENCLQPYGALVEDEWFGPTGAYRKTETCALANEECRRIQLFTLTGNGADADKIERLFFNAGAGTASRDFTQHVYLQAPNRLADGVVEGDQFSERGRFARTHTPLCCTAGLTKTLPYYIQYQWMIAPDQGPAAILYAPNRLTTHVADGTSVQIETVTDYPFGETITMTIDLEKTTSFPLWLRIPNWCEDATVTVNEEPIAVQTNERGFLRIERTWNSGDRVVLHFPMTPRLERGVDRSIPLAKDAVKTPFWGQYADADLKEIPYTCVSLGPLLLAYPVPEKDENTPEENAHWQYAMDAKTPVESLKVVRSPFPTKWNWPVDAPVKITVPAVQAKWDYDPFAPKLPCGDEIQPMAEQEIQLVPYGCAKLRVSMFPVVE